jgi:Ca2+-dependent lipid-binding protein
MARCSELGDRVFVYSLTGFSDPYCIIKAGVVAVKTRFIKKTLNPKWNEEFLM